VDTETHEVTQLPIPVFSDASGFDPVEDSWLYWESDDQFVWDLPANDDPDEQSRFLVRCIVSQARCERAGSGLEDSGAPAELVPVD
jgi:hypothetical protein